MATTDPRVDAYIEKMQPFAQDILRHLRAVVHKACPDVKETWKWSFPCFDYKNSILCSMAGFKQHAAFNFWLSTQMKDPDNIFQSRETEGGMGHLGKLTAVTDLPADKILIKYLKEAMSLIDSGAKLARKPASTEKKDVEVPEYFTAILKKNKAALKNFEAFPYSHKKEYVEWITDAKTEATREKRMATAVEWIAEGKGRNWKYERK